jgi:hypothetical protein
MNRTLDLPEVQVFDGNIEKSIKLLRVRMANSGTFRILKDRQTDVSIVERKRAKRRRAEKRRKKLEHQHAKRK